MNLTFTKMAVVINFRKKEHDKVWEGRVTLQMNLINRAGKVNNRYLLN